MSTDRGSSLTGWPEGSANASACLTKSHPSSPVANDAEVSAYPPRSLLPSNHTTGIAKMTKGVELLRPDDIAEAITYIVTRDRRVAVNEILIRAGDQTW